MLKRSLTIWLLLMVTAAANATEHKYNIEIYGGLSTLTGGDSAKFPLRENFGGSFGVHVAPRWKLDFDLGIYRNYNDTTATSSFSFRGNKENAIARFSATRLGFGIKRFFFAPDSRFNITTGLGGGLMVWKMLDPDVDSTLNVRGTKNEIVDFAASELFASASLGTIVMMSPKWSLALTVYGDYLTGAGAEFESAVGSSRDRWHTGGRLGLNFHFGGVSSSPYWRSSENWSSASVGQPVQANSTKLDSDADGVGDDNDACFNTPRGILVDSRGCPVDTDGDGAPDGLDDCPSTDRRAIGMVDIHGCPVDNDFDGIPDYLDSCPANEIGAHVDSAGCPTDADKDGVPDGLDDCENTLYGVPVDKHGCIDLTMFSKPLVLNIDYVSGSFEIDPRSRERLKDLARVLAVVPEIRLEINGYTDNIGTDVANQSLSEKRALRVRDYLVTLNVNADRIKVFGKGETNFAANNDTAAGRAKNRRIEIIFYK